MNILVLARTFPYPPNDGEKIRVFNILKSLASTHEVTLVCRAMNLDDLDNINVLESLGIRVYSIFIPPPSNNIDRIIMACPFIFSKYPLGLCTAYYKSISSVVRMLVDKINYDVIQVEHSSLSIYIDDLVLPKSTKKILTMHNIDYIRNRRVLSLQKFGVSKTFNMLNQFRYKKWEISAYSLYDRIVAMSDIDSDIIKSDNNVIEVDVVPNGVDCDNIAYKEYNISNEEYDIVFVASMDSDANNDGALFFIDEVFPLVLNLCPTAKVTMVGRRPSMELLQRDNHVNIFVTGSVEDVEPYYRKARVAIVPLRSGGGTRLKILESMAYGVPVVATNIGAEGIDVSSGVDILLADNPISFSNAIVNILTDYKIASQISISARNLVVSKYDWNIIGELNNRVFEKI
jgi:glycosyltransferase involved in cell wall biosynthesis